MGRILKAGDRIQEKRARPMKPILFNTEMVRGLLGGRKSVTRRVVKPQPLDKICYTCMGYKHGTWTYPSDDVWKYWGEEWRREQPLPEAEKSRRWTPPYHTGNILYVRETWRLIDFEFTDGDWNASVSYRADDGIGPRLHYLQYGPDEKIGWRPSIHMPKEAARLFLLVTDVRVDRLQGMQPYDIAFEGFRRQRDFVALWDSTIKKSDRGLYGWAANPWVWVIEFEQIGKDEAMKGDAGK